LYLIAAMGAAGRRCGARPQRACFSTEFSISRAVALQHRAAAEAFLAGDQALTGDIR
jgi:hypothetical protein